MDKAMVGGENKFAKGYEKVFGKKEILNLMSEEERKKVEAEKKNNEIEGRRGHSELEGMNKFLQWHTELNQY